MSALYLDAHRASVRWYSAGSGQPVLFLPGLSMSVAASFFGIAADAALAGRQKILVDYLGSGQSDWPQGFDYSLKAHARVIAAVLDRIACGPVDLVGHSMGGTVGIQLALDFPHLVRRLVVAEGNLVPGGGVMSGRICQDGEAAFLEEGCARLIARLRQKGQAGAAGADRLASGWQVADPKGIFGNAQALVALEDGFLDRFSALTCPKHFVYGQEGAEAPPTPDTPDPAMLEARGIVPHVVPGAGHAMMLDNPAGFIDVLKAAFDL